MGVWYCLLNFLFKVAFMIIPPNIKINPNKEMFSTFFFVQVRVDFVDTEMLSPTEGDCQDQYLIVSGAVWSTG